MKEKQSIKITLSGGFHNSPETFVRVPNTAENRQRVDDFKSGESSLLCLLDTVTTPSQWKRLQNHFCGIAECKCGSLARVKDVTIE